MQNRNALLRVTSDTVIIFLGVDGVSRKYFLNPNFGNRFDQLFFQLDNEFLEQKWWLDE